jgi:dGTPase
MNVKTETGYESLLAELNSSEAARLSPLACASAVGLRRRPESRHDYRPQFARDCDRVLHSRAYSRYIDKTQVFSLVDNDHITHRVLHVQLVSRIGRTIGRCLRLNEDLIEAIALGHDIGHPPFGHVGERILDQLCREHGLDGFAHNVQSVQFLDQVERSGRGWNLCLQTLDGILCHDGEAHAWRLAPNRDKDFAIHDRERALLSGRKRRTLPPMTLEGCVVRLADSIAYIGRDIEDAIELGLIGRDEIPVACARRLGNTNGTIVFNLVTDLIENSRQVRKPTAGPDEDHVGFGRETAKLLAELKQFNYERIYHNPALKPDLKKIRACYRALFIDYMQQIRRSTTASVSGELFFSSMSQAYRDRHGPAAIVRDYLAGMTDNFFLRQAARIGCAVPERRC